MSIKLGTDVCQILHSPIRGRVVQKAFVQETDSFQYLVEWPDADGDGHAEQKWFDEGQLAATGVTK